MSKNFSKLSLSSKSNIKSESSFSPSKTRKTMLLKRIIPSVLIILSAILLPLAELRADERVNPIEDTIETGSDYPLLINETPGMVIVLTYEQIRARGYRSIYEILRDLPGFSGRGGFTQGFARISWDGEFSKNNEKFLLFIDGVLEQDIWQKTVWLSFQYPVHFIKNITIFYGPAATRFGANAMSGVIFIDTKKAEDLFDSYFELQFTKDIRNNTWITDFMLGHSYTKRTYPKLAKSLFSWFVRGRFFYSAEYNSDYDLLYNPNYWENPPKDSPVKESFRESKLFLQRVLRKYREDIYNAYRPAFSGINDPLLDKITASYRQRLFNSYLDDPTNSGLFARPKFRDQNLSFSGEMGFRLDNWFFRFYLWSTSASEGLRYLPHFYQPKSEWWVRNLSISLHHLRSELWSSGVGEKAQVIYFNLNVVFRRHETPGNSYQINFLPHTYTLRDPLKVKNQLFEAKCTDIPNGKNVVPCTWKDYSWETTYYYIISHSINVEPKLDFKLLEGRLFLSTGFNTRFASIQGEPITAPRKDPQNNETNSSNSPAANQYEHLYLSAFVQSELSIIPQLSANFGLRSDWEFVRGKLEEIPNCDRNVFPCYRFSAPLIGRASLIAKFLENKLLFRLSYGYAFLAPSNKELFGAKSGESRFLSSRSAIERSLDARSLLPQDKHYIELNTYGAIASKVFISGSLFYYWLNNISALVPLSYRPFENRLINIGNQNTFGIRLYSIIKAASFLEITFNSAVIISSLSVLNYNRAENRIPITDSPIFQGNLIADLRSGPSDLSHFFGSLRLNLASGRQATVFEQTPDGKLKLKDNRPSVPFAAILHLSAGYLWIPPENWTVPKRLSFSITVENLLNIRYYDLGIETASGPFYSPVIPQPGINAFFKISSAF